MAAPGDLRISVIMCTYNPKRDLLRRALAGIARQTLGESVFELIVVDNNSDPPLDPAEISETAGRPARLVREKRQGLTYARAAGIEAARADLICFFDDDNIPAANYLEQAVAIADREPNLGVFGGVARGVFDHAVGRGKRFFLPFLGVRDLGEKPQTGPGSKWGPWEPIGAGICLRRSVAAGYVAFVTSTPEAGGLGRRGGALLSGEDSLISRIADRLGYEGGYRPKLVLEHCIPTGRLKLRYLARLMEGHGRSYILLEGICGREPPPMPAAAARRWMAANFLMRVRKHDLTHAVGMVFWDLGYSRQSRAPRAQRGDLLETLPAAQPAGPPGPSPREDIAVRSRRDPVPDATQSSNYRN